MFFRVNTDRNGPIFNGQADATMRLIIQETEDECGQEAYNQVQKRLSNVLRHPTGYYQSQITTDNRAGDVVIHDRGVIYGPWLEGVGSRNAPVTRFPGYFTFRFVKQLMERYKSREIAERVFYRHKGGLG